jgi:phosphoribosylformylglycinamidine synthase
MCIAASTNDAPLGLDITADAGDCFRESPSRYLLEVAPESLEKVKKKLGDTTARELGRFTNSGRLRIAGADLAVADLRAAWRAPLDW